MPSRVDQLCRFERLGLKWNPFRAVIPSEKHEVYIPDLYKTAALAREVALSDSPFTQVIGRAGHGKSTFLAAVADELSEADIPFQSIYLQPSLWIRVRVPQKHVRVLILDEAERLSRWDLMNLVSWVKRGGRLIVSSHRDLLTSALAAPCFRHAVTIAFPVVTVEGLQQVFRTRLRWAGDDGSFFELTADGAEWLLAVSEGNIRVVEAVLYEMFQVVADERSASGSPIVPLRIDSEKLDWLEEFGRRRAASEAAGNIPFSSWRLLSQSIKGATRKISGWLSGQTSTPGPAERGLPRSR